jgi:hypothetical protein
LRRRQRGSGRDSLQGAASHNGQCDVTAGEVAMSEAHPRAAEAAGFRASFPASFSASRRRPRRVLVDIRLALPSDAEVDKVITGNQPHDRTRPGRRTSFMISLPLGASYGCLPSLTRSRASRRRSNLGSTSAALMLWRYSKRSAGKSDSRKQSGSIKAQSLSHAISTSGLISAASRSTSPDRASPVTTLSSSRSMANSGRNVCYCANAPRSKALKSQWLKGNAWVQRMGDAGPSQL